MGCSRSRRAASWCRVVELALSLRITGGLARGRVVREPVPDGVRPTPARVREAIFSIVGQSLEGMRVLDAFGGAGMLGLEAWSRGASVVVTERSAFVVRRLRRVGEALGASWDVRLGDTASLIAGLGAFDLILADPPYADDAAPWLTRFAPAVRGTLVYESASSVSLPERVGALSLERPRRFGDTTLWIYRVYDDGSIA